MEQKNTNRPTEDHSPKNPDPSEQPNSSKDSKRTDERADTQQPNPVTDPQESMEGPVSSFIQGIKHRAERNDDKEQEEHQYKRDHTGGDFINK